MVLIFVELSARSDTVCFVGGTVLQILIFFSDVLAVILSIGDLEFRFTKNFGLQPMREISLLDASRYSVVFTLWGMAAVKYKDNENKVVMVKAARVREFSDGVRLSYAADTVVKYHPDIEEAVDLIEWFQNRRDKSVIFLSE